MDGWFWGVPSIKSVFRRQQAILHYFPSKEMSVMFTLYYILFMSKDIFDDLRTPTNEESNLTCGKKYSTKLFTMDGYF